jgi:hypothetical protein
MGDTQLILVSFDPNRCGYHEHDTDYECEDHSHDPESDLQQRDAPHPSVKLVAKRDRAARCTKLIRRDKQT